MRYDYIIWDFNGTLYDDVQASFESTNILLKDRDLPIVSNIEELRKYFCFPVKSYYKKLGFDYTKENYEDIALEWLKYYNVQSKNSKLNNGVRNILEMIKTKGIKQIIISACEKELLKDELKELGIYHYFDFICGTDNANAESKSKLAKDWAMSNPGIKKLMIGDTLHDYEVAKDIGAECVLFSGGFQSYEVLSNCDCKIIEKIEEMESIIK